MFRFKTTYLIRLFCNMHGHNVNMQGMVCFEVKIGAITLKSIVERERKKAEMLPCTLLTFAPLPTWGTCAQNYLELLSEQVRAEL